MHTQQPQGEKERTMDFAGSEKQVCRSINTTPPTQWGNT